MWPILMKGQNLLNVIEISIHLRLSHRSIDLVVWRPSGSENLNFSAERISRTHWPAINSPTFTWSSSLFFSPSVSKDAAQFSQFCMFSESLLMFETSVISRSKRHICDATNPLDGLQLPAKTNRSIDSFEAAVMKTPFYRNREVAVSHAVV